MLINYPNDICHYQFPIHRHSQEPKFEWKDSTCTSLPAGSGANKVIT